MLHYVTVFLIEAIVACPACSGSEVVGRVASLVALPSWFRSGLNPPEPGRPTRDMDDPFGWIMATRTSQMEFKVR